MGKKPLLLEEAFILQFASFRGSWGPVHDAKPNSSCSFRAGCVDATALGGQGALKIGLTNNKDAGNNNVRQLTFLGHLTCAGYFQWTESPGSYFIFRANPIMSVLLLFPFGREGH